jgi:hypothetical protein
MEYETDWAVARTEIEKRDVCWICWEILKKMC